MDSLLWEIIGKENTLIFAYYYLYCALMIFPILNAIIYLSNRPFLILFSIPFNILFLYVHGPLLSLPTELDDFIFFGFALITINLLYLFIAYGFKPIFQIVYDNPTLKKIINNLPLYFISALLFIGILFIVLNADSSWQNEGKVCFIFNPFTPQIDAVIIPFLILVCCIIVPILGWLHRIFLPKQWLLPQIVLLFLFPLLLSPSNVYITYLGIFVAIIMNITSISYEEYLSNLPDKVRLDKLKKITSRAYLGFISLCVIFNIYFLISVGLYYRVF